MGLLEEAERLLHEAFPWRAVVERPGEWAFVSVSFEALANTASADSIDIRFERDPGDTFARCTLGDLREAASTGRLRLGDRVVRQPEPDDVALLAEPFRDLIGWQSKSDAAWVSRMRLHQSWWRTFHLRVPFGTGPNKGSRRSYGNMLSSGAAGRHFNFTSDAAIAECTKRIDSGDPGVDPWRTTRNLLASQPMALNLFGPLIQDRDLATVAFDRLVGDVAEVTGGEVERLSDALGDHTAFDVFFTYRRSDGSPGCIAIETKLTEPFSQNAYEWSRYVQHSAFDTKVWNTTDTAALGSPRWSQLWRNHLLARAEAAQRSLGEPIVLVVHHPDDPHCATNVAGYQRLLCEPVGCRSVDIGTVIAAVREAAPSGDEWIDRFTDRYLRLDLSDGLVTCPGFRYEADARSAGVV